MDKKSSMQLRQENREWLQVKLNSFKIGNISYVKMI